MKPFSLILGREGMFKCIKDEVLRLWSWCWAPAVQKNAANGGGFIVKKQQQQVKVVPKQGSQTIDSLFANMKEQRMRVLCRQNNGPRRNGGRQPMVPWVRGRFGN